MSGKKRSHKSKPSNAGGPLSSSTSNKGNKEVLTKSTSSIPVGGGNNNETPAAGYLVTCDIPTKQYIQYLNDLKPADKKFILHDLDATHLLVEHRAREEIERKIEEWLDENIFSAVEKVGEDFDMS